MFLASLFPLFGLNCSRSHEKSQIAFDQEQSPSPDQESWNSTLTTTELGNITARITFGHMVKYSERDEYQFDQNLQVFFFDRNGKLKSRITSERGVLHEGENHMEVFGNVVAHADSANMTLYTERLIWDEQVEKIVTNEPVKVTTELDTLYGVGFESDVDLKHWRIRKPRGHSGRQVDLDLEKKFRPKKKE